MKSEFVALRVSIPANILDRVVAKNEASKVEIVKIGKMAHLCAAGEIAERLAFRLRGVSENLFTVSEIAFKYEGKWRWDIKDLTADIKVGSSTLKTSYTNNKPITTISAQGDLAHDVWRAYAFRGPQPAIVEFYNRVEAK